MAGTSHAQPAPGDTPLVYDRRLLRLSRFTTEGRFLGSTQLDLPAQLRMVGAVAVGLSSETIRLEWRAQDRRYWPVAPARTTRAARPGAVPSPRPGA